MADSGNGIIDNVFISLVSDEKIKRNVEVNDIDTIAHIDESLDSLSSDASYGEVKALVTQKRKALSSYFYNRNKAFMEEHGLTKTTSYFSDLNIIIGSYHAEDIIKLAQDSRVELIGYDDPSLKLESQIADEDTRVRTKNIRNAGYTGNGIKIGVIEQARAITGTTGTTYVTSVSYSGEPSSDVAAEVTHAKRVVGILRTVAPKAHIYIARATTAQQLIDAASYLANTSGVDVLNISQGLFTTSNGWSSASSYLEGLVRDMNLTICCATGNDCTSAGNNVSVLSRSCNVIGVGAVASKSSTSDPYKGVYSQLGSYYRYSEDSSSYVNKPDFCAPGFGISVPLYSLSEANGTSFSTPIVSATVALLMDKNSTLIGKQSLVKALLSAGAKYKGDEATYVNQRNIAYSQYEGTGVIDAYCSYSVLNQTRYLTKTVSQSEQGNTYSKTFNVTSSDAIIRVSLSWLKRSYLSHFDLYVYKDSTLVARNTYDDTNSNSSFSMGAVQNLRTVEFDPADYGYGTYTIKVKYRTLNNTSDSFSLAWY